MARDVSVPVGQDAKLSVRAENAENGEQVTFTIFNAADDSQIATVDGTVGTGGFARCVWASEGTEAEGTERAARVYFKAKVKGIDVQSDKDICVYHDYVEVETVLEDGSAATDVPLCLQVLKEGPGSGAAWLARLPEFPQGADHGRRAEQEIEKSSGSGTVKFDNLPPGDLFLDVAGPVRLIKWSEDPTATKFKVVVRPVKRYEITWPLGEAETEGDQPPTDMLDMVKSLSGQDTLHYQWVNLDRTAAKPQNGHVIRIKVKAHPEDGPGQKDDEVFAKVEYEPDALSKREHPRGFKGGKHEAAIKLLEDDDEGVFEVDLGHAGGDYVVVKVGGTPACEDDAIVIVNWRKLWYRLIHPSHIPAPTLTDHAKKDLLRACIVWEQTEAKSFTANDAPEPERSGFVADGSQWLARWGQVSRSFRQALFEDFDAGERKRRGINLVLADGLYDYARKDGSARCVTLTRTLCAGDEQWLALGGGFKAFAEHPADGEPPLKSGRWQILAPSGHPYVGKAGAVEELEVGPDDEQTHVQAKFPAGSEAESLLGDWEAGEAKDVKLSLTLQVRVGVGFLGYCFQDVNVCKVIEPSTVFETTVLHELGHAAGQAVHEDSAGLWLGAIANHALGTRFNAEVFGEKFDPPPGMSVGDHGQTYVAHGHRGGHCHTGLEKVATHEARTYNGLSRLAPLRGPAHEASNYTKLRNAEGERVAGECVMYGGGEETAIFCKRCLPFLKARDLRRLW